MYNEHETFFSCPYCFERISFLLEELYGAQKYIEDCEVCCQPIEIDYKITDGQMQWLRVERAQD